MNKRKLLKQMDGFLENYDYLKEEETDNLYIVLKTQDKPYIY